MRDIAQPSRNYKTLLNHHEMTRYYPTSRNPRHYSTITKSRNDKILPNITKSQTLLNHHETTRHYPTNRDIPDITQPSRNDDTLAKQDEIPDITQPSRNDLTQPSLNPRHHPTIKKWPEITQPSRNDQTLPNHHEMTRHYSTIKT
ncbi:hypothetical protein PoB_000995100 [Plakobranchus ocellatus]|uniref:Uncharacterized protein n=1 Tax=Plakobranchus ocellatus TaxID=259542 RepID=A0AAV3YJM3_9GAST|nr:hypothetical protein PoB_000995100 [Plakobranchus ocellatus]